jgi:hypothetical protein
VIDLDHFAGLFCAHANQDSAPGQDTTFSRELSQRKQCDCLLSGARWLDDFQLPCLYDKKRCALFAGFDQHLARLNLAEYSMGSETLNLRRRPQ